MINISIPAIWIAFFGALFGAMLGVVSFKKFAGHCKNINF